MTVQGTQLGEARGEVRLWPCPSTDTWVGERSGSADPAAVHLQLAARTWGLLACRGSRGHGASYTGILHPAIGRYSFGTF